MLIICLMTILLTSCVKIPVHDFCHGVDGKFIFYKNETIRTDNLRKMVKINNRWDKLCK